MERFAQFKTKKIAMLILLILLIPIILPILNYTMSFLFEIGRIIGTYIRIIESGSICIIG